MEIGVKRSEKNEIRKFKQFLSGGALVIDPSIEQMRDILKEKLVK